MFFIRSESASPEAIGEWAQKKSGQFNERLQEYADKTYKPGVGFGRDKSGRQVFTGSGLCLDASEALNFILKRKGINDTWIARGQAKDLAPEADSNQFFEHHYLRYKLGGKNFYMDGTAGQIKMEPNWIAHGDLKSEQAFFQFPKEPAKVSERVTREEMLDRYFSGLI